MKFIFILLSLISTSAFAEVGMATGYIFNGGWTYSSESYLAATLKYEITGEQINIELIANVPTEKCIKKFGPGILVNTYQILFSNSTGYTYKLPVVESCGGSAKEFRLDIAIYNDSKKVKRIYLNPNRRKSYSYFSTEWD